MPESVWDFEKSVELVESSSPVSFPSFSAIEIASGIINILGDANLIKLTNGVLHITFWAI